MNLNRAKKMKNLDDLFVMTTVVCTFEDSTKEQIYNGVQAMYAEACRLLKKKPMTAREWERKVKRIKNED